MRKPEKKRRGNAARVEQAGTSPDVPLTYAPHLQVHSKLVIIKKYILLETRKRVTQKNAVFNTRSIEINIKYCGGFCVYSRR